MEKQTKHWWVLNLTLGNRDCENKEFNERESQHEFFGTLDEAFQYFMTSYENKSSGEIRLKILSSRLSEKSLNNSELSDFFYQENFLRTSFKPKCKFNPCCYREEYLRINISCLKRNGGFDLKEREKFLKKFDQLISTRRDKQD